MVAKGLRNPMLCRNQEQILYCSMMFIDLLCWWWHRYSYFLLNQNTWNTFPGSETCTIIGNNQYPSIQTKWNLSRMKQNEWNKQNAMGVINAWCVIHSMEQCNVHVWNSWTHQYNWMECKWELLGIEGNLLVAQGTYFTCQGGSPWLSTLRSDGSRDGQTGGRSAWGEAELKGSILSS
jgi:hypothetical protein